MSPWTWIFLGIVVVLLLAVLLTRRASGVDPTQLLLDPELVTKVRALAQQHQQVAAIKMLREGTPGLGLASAKVMVDRMAGPRAAVAQGTGVPVDVETQARSLKNSGNIIGAVKLVRGHLPDLGKAKAYVDSL